MLASFDLDTPQINQSICQLKLAFADLRSYMYPTRYVISRVPFLGNRRYSTRARPPLRSFVCHLLHDLCLDATDTARPWYRFNACHRGSITERSVESMKVGGVQTKPESSRMLRSFRVITVMLPYLARVVLADNCSISLYQCGTHLTCSSIFEYNVCPFSKMPSQLEERIKGKRATFGMGCFWAGDSLFGVLPGVIRTCVGYAGGTKESPSYKNM